MRDVQKVITPLVESAIKVEPATPPSMGINTRIQRAWAFMFGRRENTLQPIYASRGGMMGTVALDLNGWRLAYNAVPTDDAWTDMGEMVDLVIFGGADNCNAYPYIEFGPTTGTVQYVMLPDQISLGEPIGAPMNVYAGRLHARVRWYQGVNIFGDVGHVIGYVAPNR